MSAYYRPHSLDDALSVLDQLQVVVAAGCTDLFPAIEQQELGGTVLDLTAIDGLRGILETRDGWRIGATTTWSDILSADLPPAFDMLRQAAREVGSPQIQNAGTVAGNICNASPAADGMPPLLALNAQVELTCATGHRTMALGDFVSGVRQTRRMPQELVTAIHVPRLAGEGNSRFLKLGARKYLVISIAMVAVRISIHAGRVADLAVSVGSCSAVATRLHELERRLIGQPPHMLANQITREVVGAELSPISDVRGDATYRVTAATELLRRAFGDLTGAGGRRVL